MNADINNVMCPFGPDWKVVKEIGHGSYGNVYLIEQRIDNRTSKSAMKVIRIPESEADVEKLRKATGKSDVELQEYYELMSKPFISEIQLMDKLKGYSHIVSYQAWRMIAHDSGIGKDIYIQMEYLTPLRKWMRGKTMTNLDIVDMAIQLCEGLKLCAQNGIVHRDIKPDNIFVNDSGNYKLGDFGIAQRLDQEEDVADRKLGSPNYMAPEVSDGKHSDIRADIYGLGMVMYRLLNENKIPFLDEENGNEEKARARRFKGDKLPKPVHVSDVLWPIIEKACAYHAEDRYSSADKLSDALFKIKNNPELQHVGINSGLSVQGNEKSPRSRSTGPEGTTVRDPSQEISTGKVVEPEPEPDPEPAPEPKPKPEPRKWVMLLTIVGISCVIIAVVIALAIKLHKPDVKTDDVVATTEGTVLQAVERYDDSALSVTYMKIFQYDRDRLGKSSWQVLRENEQARDVTVSGISLTEGQIGIQENQYLAEIAYKPADGQSGELDCMLALRLNNGEIVEQKEKLPLEVTSEAFDLDSLLKMAWEISEKSWPEGNARLELYVDGRLAQSVSTAIVVESLNSNN